MGKGKCLLVVALLLLLVFAMLVGAWSAWIRHLQESNNRQVELAIDARLLGDDDRDNSFSPQDKLLELQKAGCTAVAVSPLSLNELERMGEIVSLTPTLYLVTGKAGLGEQLQAAFSLLLPEIKFKKIEHLPFPFTAALNQMAMPGGKQETFIGETTMPDGLAAGNEITNEVAAAALYNENLPAPGAAVAGGAAEYQTFSIPARYAPAVKELPLLFPKQQISAWQRAGLRVVPLFNYPTRLPSRLGEKYWEALARQLQEIKQTTGFQFGPLVFPAISFSYPVPHSAAGLIFQEEGFSLGAVEFTQGQGLHELAAALDYRLLRTHQIPGAELAQLGEARARERFLRAVQERKIRLLWLQPFPEFDPRNEITSYLSLIRNLNKDLQKAGFSSGEASFFPPFQPSPAAGALLGAGIAAAVVFLASFFLERSSNKETSGGFSPSASAGTAGTMAGTIRRSGLYAACHKKFFPLAALLLLLAVTGFLLAGERLPFYTLGRQLIALAAALIFPLLSTLLFLKPPLDTANDNCSKNNILINGNGNGNGNENGRNNNEKNVSEKKEGAFRRKNRHMNLVKRLSGGFLLASLLTTGGALLAAGLLGSTPFLLKIESFRGVKIAQAGPFILLGLWFLLQDGQGLWRAGHDFLETRLRVKHLVLLALAGGILLIYLLRGGNTPLLPVSSWELALRRRLEILLIARPRFKEFLIGHPGFFLFAALTARRLPGAGILALLLGLLGQISLFNTFMHLHRPVGLSLLGTAYGVGLGLLGGVALYVLAGIVARRWP